MTVKPPHDKLPLVQSVLELDDLVDDLVGDAAVVFVEQEDRLAGARRREQAAAV